MKTFRVKHFLSPLIMVFGAVLFGACTNTLNLSYYPTESQTELHNRATQRAIEFFESSYDHITRSSNQEPTEEVPYVLGEFYPHWDNGTTAANELRSYSEYTLSKESRFLLYPKPNNDEETIDLHSRFISIIDNERGATCQYIVTYIPDTNYIPTYIKYVEDDECNVSEWGDFSGFVLYTMLSGHHVAVYRYNDGVCVDGAFLYDRYKTTEENIDDFLDIVKGLKIGIVVGGTRSDEPIYGGTGDPIEIIYTRTFPIIIIEDPDDIGTTILDGLVDPLADGLGGPGGGGGSTTTSQDQEQPTPEDVRKKLFGKSDISKEEEQEVEEMLRQILRDCLGEELCRQLMNSNYDIEIRFDYYSPTSRFGSDDSGLVIILRDYRSAAFLHEMIHAYQAHSLGAQTFNNSIVNLEVQAYLAMYLYLLGNQQYDPQIKAHAEKFHRYNPGAYIIPLSGHFGSGYNVNEGTTTSILESDLQQALSKIDDYYRNKNNPRTVDFNQSISDFLSLFEELSKNC